MKSSYCATGNCVEVDFLSDGNVAVANSKEPNEFLIFTREEWDAFVKGVRAGEFAPKGE